MKAGNIIINLLMAIVGGILAVVIYTRVDDTPSRALARPDTTTWHASLPQDFDPDNLDFTYAAEQTVFGVVHVKTTRQQEGRQAMDPFEFFFGPRDREEPEPQVGFGSGVIISSDGAIVTNHHVIRGADAVEVTLNDGRTFEANVQGTDPNTDIALLKIDATNLPYLEFGSSDALRIGEWVLAVGNPFGLTSSVTAGIISAKERALGVLSEGQMPIESFLQTDAAVNMGNSGGALVNLRGELVGIPTLIISPTRTNIGNAFAVPSSIVKRVTDDIREFGEVRRGVLGVSIMGVTSELAQERDLEEIEGVYVESVVDGSAADQAGIEPGDVILEVDGKAVNSTVALQQAIGLHKPDDQVEMVVKRNGRTRELTARLMSLEEHQELLREQEEEFLGATLRMAPQEIMDKFNLSNGVQVVELERGTLSETGMRAGFIIIAINNVPISQPGDVARLLEDYSGNVYIEGVYPSGTGAVYTFSL